MIDDIAMGKWSQLKGNNSTKWDERSGGGVDCIAGRRENLKRKQKAVR